ncbi:MAG TPA: hypothetical protein VG734_07535 [Lacunisphaera sp.]|nr:hypothetical protein [Lacunisphaera sp.]
MRSRFLLLILGLAVVGGLLSSCRKTEWTKQEVVEWYAQYGSAVRGGLLYRGSDQQWHYFVARVMDDWAFIQIKKEELKIEDERVYSQASSAPFSFYAVDPSQGFRKIEQKKEANQTPVPMSGLRLPTAHL